MNCWQHVLVEHTRHVLYVYTITLDEKSQIVNSVMFNNNLITVCLCELQGAHGGRIHIRTEYNYLWNIEEPDLWFVGNRSS